MTDVPVINRRKWSEADRLAALDRYLVMDSAPEDGFTDLVEIAAQICGTPMALISLIDDHRQWFKAAVGLAASETPREIAFCAHAIQQDDVFVVGDATQDPRFVDNPLVTGDPNLRFYAGATLQTADGFPLGTLCVLDNKPRQLTPQQLTALNALSRQVMSQLELRRALQQQRALLEEKDLLMQEVHHRVKNSLAMVQSLLLLQARAATDEAAARQLQESAGRIHTFEAIHEHLYRVGAAARVDMATYLGSLIAAQREAISGGFGTREIVFDASSAWWPSSEAPMLGLVLIELLTNALKYGAGTITVTLAREKDLARLIVADEGNGVPDDFDPSRSKGLGMRIIMGLLRGQGRGELAFDRTQGHTRFIATLTAPASRAESVA